MKILVTGSDGSLGSYLENVLVSYGHTVIGISMDLINYSKYDKIESIIKSEGDFDQIYNVHGINHLSHIGSQMESLDYKIMDVNVNAYYNIINLVFKHQSDYYTKVLNVASQTYRVAQRKSALYCASKAAVVQLTKVIARELAPSNWVVNCIAPGMIEGTLMSKMTNNQVLELRGWDKESAEEYAKSMIPMGRFTDLEEVVEAMVRIMELPDYINGSCIDMTGGI